MAAPKLKLTYFDMAGRAESTRLALHLGGIAFEDERIARSDWPALKSKMPNGQIPVLQVNDTVLTQSLAILRYAGKLAGLYPSDPLAAARVDEILGMLEDVSKEVVPSLFEPNAEKQAAMRKKLAEETLPLWFKRFEARLQTSGDYFVETLSIADLQAYVGVGWYTSGTLDGIPATILDPFPLLKAFRDRMAAQPKIAEWNKQHAKKA